MPRNKDLKRLVRARMQKTGEAYTAARAHITARPEPVATKRAQAAARAADYAALAGMSDAAIKAKTGCGWESWVKTLDYHNASQLPHREISEIVSKTYKIKPWWTQAVAVGYERIKGLRARGQRRDGSYEASKSRTFNVPVATLFDACATPAARRRWLDGASTKMRTATRPRSMRLDWPEGGTVAFSFTGKGTAKSVISIQHAKLRDKESATRLKQFWSERLDALGDTLGVRARAASR